MKKQKLIQGKYRYANAHDMYELLGLGRNGKLPSKGISPAVIIQGVRVYIKPLLGDKPKHGKRNAHRVMVICSCCERHMSAGRLHQHVCPAKQL